MSLYPAGALEGPLEQVKREPTEVPVRANQLMGDKAYVPDGANAPPWASCFSRERAGRR